MYKKLLLISVILFLSNINIAASSECESLDKYFKFVEVVKSCNAKLGNDPGKNKTLLKNDKECKHVVENKSAVIATVGKMPVVAMNLCVAKSQSKFFQAKTIMDTFNRYEDGAR